LSLSCNWATNPRKKLEAKQKKENMILNKEKNGRETTKNKAKKTSKIICNCDGETTPPKEPITIIIVVIGETIPQRRWLQLVWKGCARDKMCKNK